MIRVGALAAALALAGIVPLSHLAQAGEVGPGDTKAVTDSPVGVLLMGGGPEGEPPVVEDPAPPTKTPDDSPPANEPAPPPSNGTTTAPVTAAPGASAAVRPPRLANTQLAAPAAAASSNSGPLAASAKATPRGEGVSLEDIFLNSRATYAGAAATPSRVGRSAILMPNSSLPSMVLTTLFGMLGVLLLASRYYGSSFFAWPLGASLQRRSAPRGWRVVATAPLPVTYTAASTISDLERPVLAAVSSPATSSR